jgi:superfamily II DNA/RNA helicase
LPAGNLANSCCLPATIPRGLRHNRCLKGTINVTTNQSFADLGVGEPLIKVLATRGIVRPFPIQVETLPDTLAGRDVLGRGRTGSGKTLAFSIPLVDRLARMRHPSRPTGLVLAPTRELATQIAAVLEPLAAADNLKATTIFGGVPQNRQVAALKSGIDIVVACPGRLEDLMRQRIISLETIEITVLDEADHMADLGFLPGVTRILAATPGRGQRLLFSATLDNGVDMLVKRFLRNQAAHSVDAADSPVPEMTHHVFQVAGVEAKKELVHHLASGAGRRILFMRTKHQARKLARQLTESGVPSVDLHGNLSNPRATATSRLSPRARCGCWWPPTSPHVVCTLTRWSSSCMWSRPSSTRHTCTGPAARHAPAAQARSSPWYYPNNAKTCRQ